ncbi:MAG: hypothetical protein RLO50_18670 [Azospirillaceae bacterium]
MTQTARFAALLAVMVAAQPAQAQLGPRTVTGDPANPWDGRVLSEAELNGVRGGFVGVAGLTHFAIDLDTWIDAEHVYSATWTPTGGLDVRRDVPGADYAVEVDTTNGLTTTIQNGLGNEFATGGLDAGGLVTVVQNNLDGAAIRHSSTIELEMSRTVLNQARRGRFTGVSRQFLNGM